MYGTNIKFFQHIIVDKTHGRHVWAHNVAIFRPHTNVWTDQWSLHCTDLLVTVQCIDQWSVQTFAWGLKVAALCAETCPRYSVISTIICRVWLCTPTNIIETVLLEHLLFIRLHLHFKAYWLCDASTGLTFKNCTLCPHCIDVFCVYVRINSYLCHLNKKLIGFYNRDKKCLQRGTDWTVK
jgi:hypothetical protein